MTCIRNSFRALVIASLLSTAAVFAEPAATIDLWPGKPPGDQGDIGTEHDTTKPSDHQVAGKPVIRTGNVSKPSVTVFRARAAKETGTAVVVCPGGGYNILAWDLEGTEVCEWLNSIGVTGILLKYRVPKRPGLDKHTAALQDAQRAIGLARQHAREWGINPARIGILGFSAGGHLAALSGTGERDRAYPRVDAADELSCRPDFTMLIYPAYLTVKDQGDAIAPDLKLSTNYPPTFIAMAQDDPVRVETALYFAAALQKLKVPLELHIYPTGGHGYGLRPAKDYVTTWPARAADWMRSRGLCGP